VSHIRTKPSTDTYRENYDRIFGPKRKAKAARPCPFCGGTGVFTGAGVPERCGVCVGEGSV
jgi:DnaJ-class molecular chaperone